MANSSEIRDTKKSNLSCLYAVKVLGGDIDMAIVQARAAMDKSDVEDVEKEYEEFLKKGDK
ncbi:MAG: hypothetical protein FWG83_00805 [Oscillospiraceae bacterium]|nr:hypothetical protein [Oscillospiraceae bacterium]